MSHKQTLVQTLIENTPCPGWLNNPVELTLFRKKLKVWGRKNFRPFPWRLSENPYHILMAEVMLHRTQASQVLPVYERFITCYPDISTLTQTTKGKLRRLLYPLGLQWRVDLLYKMAISLIRRFDGQVPQDKSDLLSLPGVSQYIAGAVRCFAWNFQEPLIDTNTVRVVGRLFGLEIKDSSRRNHHFKELIEMLVDPRNPRAYNYALLDLADSVCTKKRPPDCKRCPVAKWCHYGCAALR